MDKIFSERFWSEQSALRAAQRMARKGYSTKVRFAMFCDGHSDWLLEVFA